LIGLKFEIICFYGCFIVGVLDDCFSGGDWFGNMIACGNGASMWWNESWVILIVTCVRVVPSYLAVWTLFL
jgi:hypothetical protein